MSPNKDYEKEEDEDENSEDDYVPSNKKYNRDNKKMIMMKTLWIIMCLLAKELMKMIETLTIP